MKSGPEVNPSLDCFRVTAGRSAEPPRTTSSARAGGRKRAIADRFVVLGFALPSPHFSTGSEADMSEVSAAVAQWECAYQAVETSCGGGFAKGLSEEAGHRERCRSLHSRFDGGSPYACPV